MFNPFPPPPAPNLVSGSVTPRTRIWLVISDFVAIVGHQMRHLRVACNMPDMQTDLNAETRMQIVSLLMPVLSEIYHRIGENLWSEAIGIGPFVVRVNPSDGYDYGTIH